MPTVEELQRELADLRAIVSDLASRPNVPVNTSEDAQEATSGASGVVAPFWEATECTGLTLTAGISDDWEVRFDTPTATNKIKYQIATSSGELNDLLFGTAQQRRYKIAWDQDSAYSITVRLAGTSALPGEAAGTVQLKLNGQLYEYSLDPAGTAEYVLTLEGKVGRNQLAISTGYHPFCIFFAGRLWDDTTGGTWVDPRGEQGYVKL